MSKQSQRTKKGVPHSCAAAARAAFPCTIPILTGFLVLGVAYGIYMKALGFSPLVPVLISIFVFAGSMQFVAGSLLTGAFAPVSTFFLTLMVNARHLFYGLSMLEKYSDLGKKKLPTIFWMCDETFSVNVSAEIPEGVDKGWFYFFVSFFDYSYWVLGTVLGAVLGQFIPFDTTGIDFAMTALFLVILVGQWEKETSHVSTLAGLIISLLCLIFFGPDHFIVASMVGILLFLTLLRRPLERSVGE